VTVAGDSAGSNLAAATRVHSRDEDGSTPDAAALLCLVTHILCVE